MIMGGADIRRRPGVLQRLVAVRSSPDYKNEPETERRRRHCLTYFRRTLWYDNLDKTRELIGEGDLLARPECLVVLGEPGMGKTELLGELANSAGTVRYTARQLINRPDPCSLIQDATVVVIDGLDEVAARHDGDAVDLVLQRLAGLGYPRFVLSCREYEWQAAISVAAIQEQYPAAPLQLHLVPLDREQQLALLNERVGDTRARHLIEHFAAFGLDYLGNPQTLDLIARLPEGEPLPADRTGVFDLVVDKLRVEHRDGARHQELPRDVALDAAGAAFAALILTGSSAIRRTGQANLQEGDLSFAEVDALAGEQLDQVLRTRLFVGGNDRFTYLHRRIGEFLGAAWLARRADTRVKRRRLLHIFHAHGLVPTSLRGLHAWLARDPTLADEVIGNDPMGMIENGDADILTPRQSRRLFEALEVLATRDPRFWRRGIARAGVLVSAPLQQEALRVLRDRGGDPGFRLLLLEQFTQAQQAAPYRDTLLHLLEDAREIFAVRREAGAALARLDGEDWPALVEGLRLQADRDSLRLAYERMLEVGLPAFSNSQIADVVLTYEGLVLSAWPRQEADRLAVRFWRLPDAVPLDRIDGLLDILADNLLGLLPRTASIEHNNLIDAIHGLLLRRLDGRTVDALQLLSWLRPLDGRHFYNRDKAAVLAARLRNLDDVRQSIQRRILLDGGDDPVWRRHTRLVMLNPGLQVDEADAVALLSTPEAADLEDDQWFDLLCLVPHHEEKGEPVRRAAATLWSDNAARRELLGRLENPPIPEWQVEQEREARQHAAERAERLAQDRTACMASLDQIRRGESAWVRVAAHAYLKRFWDVGGNIPAHSRVAEWLGPDVAAAAHEGFEAFLHREPRRPDAARIAISHARYRGYGTGDIIVSALAERLRVREFPFSDLSDERLMTGLFLLWASGAEELAGISGLADRLEADLRARGAWEATVRLFVGAQLRRPRDHVDRLHQVMRAEADQAMATALALEWLQRFPALPATPEAELIDRVLHSPRRGELAAIGASRQALPLDDDRRRNWDAVAVLIDFDAAAQRLDGTVEPELIWHVRLRSGSDREEDRALTFSPRQIAWLVTTFRSMWPARPFPTGMTTGTTSAWDATSFLSDLVARLGESTTDEAIDAMASLERASSDGYTSHIRAVAAEQRRKGVEQAYRPPLLRDIARIVVDAVPGDAADLQALMLENLRIAQEQLRGSDVDWYRGFFRESGAHKDEEDCRDEIIKLLRTIDPRLDYIPETHVADDKRVDIVGRAAERLIVPIEIKGEWHRDLWTAADAQLDHRYVNDWRAERGIYVVLWFGGSLQKPPSGVEPHSTPADLCHAIGSASRARRTGRVDVVVLDLTRPAPV